MKQSKEKVRLSFFFDEKSKPTPNAKELKAINNGRTEYIFQPMRI